MSLVDDLLPHMRRVLTADRDLHDLGLLWQMIEASSAISCPEEAETVLPTLSETRASFAGLQQRLVQQLGEAHLAELGDELASVAQCTIDILVRNLFERTADVGFLATDDVLRDFCAAAVEARAAALPAMRRRLAEYRAKYTVYDDIVVLDPEGLVLARLDEQGGPLRSGDPIVAAALARSSHVERHAVTDLAADQRAALLYGHRIEAADGRPLGVLVLRFRCIDELQRIFRSVADDRRHVAVALVDGEGCVLVSNDEAHVPPAARLQTAADGEVAVTVFGGREYLSVTCCTRGYQGYAGPGWRAQAMVSLLTAFRGSGADGERDDERQVALDNQALRRIQDDVDAINRNLRRVVWNGRLMAGRRGGAQAQLKAVLTQVNGAGSRTRDRVAAAIADLYRTALGRAHHQAREMARLAADIMDRNLYERANDCRWWALSPVLQRVLAHPADAAGTAALQAVLQHINGLYTVYARLVVFDRQGVIRGVSNDHPDQPLLGRSVDDALCRAAFALQDSQRYAVTAFEASPLSDGVPTYVYLAAVRAGGDGAVLGGIAIVFHAEREFRAMLDDVLGERAGLAAFVDAAGQVLSCTDERFGVGSSLPFVIDGGIVDHDGAHLAVASMPAVGYREFKHDDGYRNGVRVVVALRLGTVERRRQALHDGSLRAWPVADRRRTRELALFQVGAGRYALPLDTVLEARPPRGLVRTAGSRGSLVGLLDVPTDRGAVVVPVHCARRLFGVDYPARAGDGIVLLMPAAPGGPRPAYGLRVDHVTTVLEVGEEQLQPVHGDVRGADRLVSGVVRLEAEGGESGPVLVQLVDGATLAGLVGVAAASIATPAMLDA